LLFICLFSLLFDTEYDTSAGAPLNKDH
jgi:hypothetical protein